MMSRSIEDQAKFNDMVNEFLKKGVISKVPEGVRGLPIDIWEGEDIQLSHVESDLTVRAKGRIMVDVEGGDNVE